MRVYLHFFKDLGVLWEYSLVKESFSQTISFYFFLISHVDELTLAKVNHIVITH